MCSRHFSKFLCISFSVSYFICRSLIHLYLSFVQGNKNGLISILLHASCHLKQHHLSKRLCFFPLDGFSFFVKDGVTIGVWVHFWVFISIPLIYLPVTVPIPCCFYHYCSVILLDDQDTDSPRSSFIVQNSFSYTGFHVIPDEFDTCSF